jgi:hypothetical protein
MGTLGFNEIRVSTDKNIHNRVFSTTECITDIFTVDTGESISQFHNFIIVYFPLLTV